MPVEQGPLPPFKGCMRMTAMTQDVTGTLRVVGGQQWKLLQSQELSKPEKVR